MKLAAKLFILLGFAFAAIALITVLKARSNEARAEAAYPPVGQFLQVDDVRVHAVVRGQGPDLVLIHGSSGSTRDFTFSLMDRLSDRYRVIALDRPGLGYSAPIKDATLSRQAALLQMAAAQLGAKRPIVLGQSYGGSVALAWALNHPENTAALVAVATPSLPWETPLSTYYKILSHPLLGPLTIPVLTAWISNARVAHEVESVFKPQNAPAGYADHFGPGLTLRRSSLRANAMQRANLLAEITALAPRWPEITAPTEFLHGDLDTTVGLEIHSRPLSARIRTARLTIINGVGHMPQHVAEDQVIVAIDRAATRAGLNPTLH